MTNPLYFVFDVESIGLHGEVFAWGYVVVGRDGKEHGSSYFACNPKQAYGSNEGRKWVADNMPEIIVSNEVEPKTLREVFWTNWLKWKTKGAIMAADCPWPVEAGFLTACVRDAQTVYRGEPPNDGPRAWEGPYPLIDVASVRLAAGFDPLAKVERLADEMPEHDPLADARQSARLLIEALQSIRGKR